MRAKEKRPEQKSSSPVKSVSKWIRKIILLLVVMNSTLEAPSFEGYKQT